MEKEFGWGAARERKGVYVDGKGEPSKGFGWRTLFAVCLWQRGEEGTFTLVVRDSFKIPWAARFFSSEAQKSQKLGRGLQLTAADLVYSSRITSEAGK